MAFKSMQEFKEHTKGLNKKQLKEFLDNLSDEEQQIIIDDVILQHKVHYTFKDDDFIDYTDDEEELNRRILAIKETISNYSQEDLDYSKESLLNPYILKVLAHCIKDPSIDLDTIRLNDLITNWLGKLEILCRNEISVGV